MIAITCDKCRRRFTPTVEEIRADLAAAQGKKHAQMLCPHCGKANNVALERLREAVRFAPAAPTAPATPDQTE
jgi:hypothetical protein